MSRRTKAPPTSSDKEASAEQLSLFDGAALRALASGQRSWAERYEQERQRAQGGRTAPGAASGGRELAPLHTPADLAEWSFLEELGFPGEYPLTRGIYSSMYRSRLWTMRQYAGFATAEETNQRFHYLLDGGQTGLSVAFDLPTQIGYDSDHPLARGEVGRVGVAVDSIRDMEVLFDGIDIGSVTTSMTINATAATLLALYCGLAVRRGVALDKLGGTVQNDILKEYIARGTYIYPPTSSLRLVTDTFRFCADNIPRWNSISISGYHIREAGSTAAQEIAFTLANAIAYNRGGSGCRAGGRRVRAAAVFLFQRPQPCTRGGGQVPGGASPVARIMRERFRAADPRSWRLRFHAQTAGSTLTAQQPINNVVRVALQALAAVWGGCQSLHTNSMDEALALPTEEAARTALRTQQLLAFEHGTGDTVDPLGGSYTVEVMTRDLEEESTAILEAVDQLGGMVAAIEDGHVQREIEKSAYADQMAVEAGERVVVGINRFDEGDDGAAAIAVQEIPAGLEERKSEKLAELRRSRDKDAAERALDGLEHAARGTENLIGAILAAVQAEATLGEVADRMRHVFGEYRDPRAIY